ncbi:hypothetical protein ACRC7T_15000 [Segnochrobactraceae bacterium EtOH-i3]
MTTHVGPLLKKIERHCRNAGIAESTFGLRAANDGKLVGKLRGGRTITLKTLAKIEAALARPAARRSSA